MFRILIQTKASVSPASPAAYQYLMDGGKVWETDDKDEALAKYEAELDNYKKSLLTLIVTIEVDLNPTAEGCPCGDKYRITEDTVYLADKEYFVKDGDNYVKLIEGVNYQVGDPIVGTIYELDDDDNREF